MKSTTNFVTINGTMATAVQSYVIVEPVLSISSTISTTTAKGGDTITFTVTVSHAAASTADAFFLTISNPLFPTWLLSTSSISVSNPSATVSTTGGNIILSLERLTLGSSVKLTYNANLTPYALYSTIYSNTWTANAVSSLSSYSRAVPQLTSSVSLQTVTLRYSNSYSGDIHGNTPTNLSPGEVLTWVTTLTLPAGQSPALVVALQLGTSGALFSVVNTTVLFGNNVNSSTIVNGGPGAVTDTNNDGYTDSAIYNLGQVLVDPSSTINVSPSPSASFGQVHFS